MTAVPAFRPAPSLLAEGWRVEIPMPVFPDGKDRGKPVGWLNLNAIGTGARGAIKINKAKKQWRIAAALAYKKHRVPQNLGAIYVLVGFRFSDRRHRDPSNYELTIKPVIDALQPQKSGIRYNPALKKQAPFVDHGWGVVPGDDPRFVTRGPELQVGDPLGTKNPVKGMVIVHIFPMPTTT